MPYHSPMDGYAKVASLMATHDEFAILRRFRVLNLQNLLYLQAEITHLEEELNELANQDSTVPGREYHSRDWWSLANGCEEEDQEQWEKVLELREKLDKYNEALLKQSQISQLNDPSDHNLKFLRSWLQRPKMGNFPLVGLDRKTWELDHEGDLLSLRPPDSQDYLSTWFLETFMPMYHHLVGKNFNGPDPHLPGVYSYENKRLIAILYCLKTVIASMLPICSVVVLYLVESNDVRLGLTVLFCAIFAMALVLVTSAKKVEVFAATAAFAAVNVVFLSNNQCEALIMKR